MQNQHRKSFNLYIYNPKNEVISSLIRHIYNKSLSEFLSKLLNQDVIRSDYKNEVIDLIILDDGLKRDVLKQIIG